MPKKQKPLPSVEESLKAAAALAVDAKRDAAEIRRDLAEIVRDRKREAAEREAERKRDAAAREAERKEREAERKQAAAERKQAAAERKRAAAEREADRKREAAEREADRKREAAEREADRKREAAARAAERKEREAERKKDKAALAEWQAKHTKNMADIEDQWGGYTNGEGEILEDEVCAALRASKKIGGIRLDRVASNLCGDTAQYDAVGINGKVSVLVSIKRTLRLKHVRQFVRERMRDFAGDFPEFTEDKDFIGAMVYARTEGRAAEEALNAGLILLRAEGKKGLREIKTAEDARRPETKPAARAKKR